METKVCNSCGELRRLNQFRRRRDGVTRRSRCRRCTKAVTARARAGK